MRSSATTFSARLILAGAVAAAAVAAPRAAAQGGTAAPASGNETPGAAGAEITHVPPVHRPHWEYGFDLEATRVLDTFTPYIGAQWNYIFKPFDTMFGVAASAMPQQVSKEYADVGPPATSGKRKTSLYTWGLDVRQDFVADGYFTLGASVALGSGVAYIRDTPETKPSTIHGITVRHVEPGVYGTFY